MLFEKATARSPLSHLLRSFEHTFSFGRTFLGVSYLEKAVYQHHVACGQLGISMPIHHSLIKLQLRMGIVPHSGLNSN